MKHFALPIFLGLLAMLLVGCPSREEWSCPELSPSNSEMSSKPDKIIIQIDGTPSMKGFVNNSNSRYIRTLRLLRGAANTAFPATSSPTFYVFGTQRLKEPISHQSAETVEFYSGGNPNLRDAATSKIVQPQKTDSSNSLYVIVTDLYQENAQWEELVANLKDHYLLKNKTVGIVAVKSEFSGDIYDVGLKGIRYPNVKTNHPFYILVLGQYPQVKQYFDAIKSDSQKRGLNFPDENFVIFSTQIFEKPTFLEINKNELPDEAKRLKIRRVQLINDGKINMKIKNLQNTERLIVPSQEGNDSPKEVSSTYTLNYHSLPYTLSLSSINYQLDNQSDFNQGTKKFTKLETQNASPPIPLKLDSQSINNDQLKFNTLFNLDNNNQGIYRLVFNIFPEKISDTKRPYQAPSWWKDWSFGENEFAGDKTYNLQPFLYNLGDTSFKIIEDKLDAPLGRLCFVIHKK